MMVRIVFHLLPLAPLFFGFRWLSMATALLVCVSYIKVRKIEQQLKDLKIRGVDPQELESISAARDFWLGLTFLKGASED